MKKTILRELTHALIYEPKSGRWSCKCGYVLGSGHSALYARCPMYHRRKREPEAYADSSISSAPKHEKTQRKARRTGSGVSQTALDLFDC